MGAQGTTTVNFGSSLTGTLATSTTITGQASLLTGSLVEAWVYPLPTADHSSDEHVVDPPVVSVGNLVVGTGFTIYASAPPNPADQTRFSDAPRHYGAWTVAWVWN